MEWAVRKIQQNYRGRRKLTSRSAEKKKMDKLRQEYIGTKSSKARERWEADQYEIYREKIERELAEEERESHTKQK